MIRIGILGDIGSGKSYVAKNFGYPVFNADHEVSKIYEKDSIFSSTKQIRELIKNFNQTGQGKQNHTILDAFMDWKVLWSALVGWLALYKIGRKLRKLGPSGLEENYYLWPFIQIDFEESLYGRTAINNLLFFKTYGIFKLRYC